MRHGPNICAGSRWSHSYESQPQLLDPERQLRDVKLHVSIRSCKGSFENFAPLYQRLCLCVSSMFFLFFCWIVNVPCLVFLLSVLEFLFHCCHCTSTSEPRSSTQFRFKFLPLTLSLPTLSPLGQVSVYPFPKHSAFLVISDFFSSSHSFCLEILSAPYITVILHHTS